MIASRLIEDGDSESSVSNIGRRSFSDCRFQLVCRTTSGFDKYAYHEGKSLRSS